LVLLAVGRAPAAETPTVRPYERETWATPANGVDTRVLAALQQAGVDPAHPCSDEVFIRRVYLDVTGTLPEPSAVRRFLLDPAPAKRATLIDALLQRDEFADYAALKWCDLLRVKAEFPINLWPNAAQAYHGWIRDAIQSNLPYDQFVRALLTSSGSNFRVPCVNFYRAVQGRQSDDLAQVVALSFMGTRLATWTPERRADLAVFFSRVAYKSSGEWKEEIVYPDLTATAPLPVVFPDGSKAVIAAGDDPRVAFADWLTKPDNPWLARAVVNRLWAWLLGRGIINEPDDIRPDNPPANPELLAYLAQQLVADKWDLRQIYRLILNSRTYQQSALPRSNRPEAEALCASYPVRRLDAEVLADALDWVGGTAQSFVSPIPEPFTYLPSDQRSVALPDGSITSPFLMRFGRPARDTGLESERSNTPSDAQQLYLLNSSEVQQQIIKSPRLRAAAAAAGGDRAALIQEVYLTLLSRNPMPAEQAAAEAYAQTPGLGPNDAATDLAWALINSAEFQYRH
jgi:hypothetical protein